MVSSDFKELEEIKAREYRDLDSGNVTSVYEVGTVKLCFTIKN